MYNKAMETPETNEPSPEQLEQTIETLYVEAGELRESYYGQMEEWVQDIWDDVEIEADMGIDRKQAKDRLVELIENVKRIIASSGSETQTTM